MSADQERGIVYVPVEAATGDMYGGHRLGDNLFTTSLVALDARTGKRRWHYQFVRHDIWDRDPPAPPTLVTVQHEGRKVDAVAQVTKSGFVFVFDRETGQP
ncbi:MAG: pyrroloquinoline quinone-dependent dehydrogenase, partial [Acidimicrobiia bacterium]|nr:pyrroloquinoline quinone-dependent dehydrogenase [Acidimicrobiia bacterium]